MVTFIRWVGIAYPREGHLVINGYTALWLVLVPCCWKPWDKVLLCTHPAYWQWSVSAAPRPSSLVNGRKNCNSMVPEVWKGAFGSCPTWCHSRLSTLDASASCPVLVLFERIKPLALEKQSLPSKVQVKKAVSMILYYCLALINHSLPLYLFLSNTPTFSSIMRLSFRALNKILKIFNIWHLN